jgi:hypothetical protein
MHQSVEGFQRYENAKQECEASLIKYVGERKRGLCSSSYLWLVCYVSLVIFVDNLDTNY